MDPKSPTEGPPCSAGLVHRSLWWQRWHRVTDGMVLTWWAWWSGWQTTKCSLYDSSEQKGQTAAGAWGLSSLLWANRRPSVHTLTWAAETLPIPGGSAHHGLSCKEADSGEKKEQSTTGVLKAKQDIFTYSATYCEMTQAPNNWLCWLTTLTPQFSRDLMGLNSGAGIRPNTAGSKTDRHEPLLLPRKPFETDNLNCSKTEHVYSYHFVQNTFSFRKLSFI